MKKLSNPRDLLIATLSELLWVERRLAFDVLPKIVRAVGDDELTRLFSEHHEQTKLHVERVEQAFGRLGIEPSSALSPGFSGLAEQHDTLTKKIVEPSLADRWHVAAGIATEHFELALYTGIGALADDELRELLAPNVSDEEDALDKLKRRAGA